MLQTELHLQADRCGGCTVRIAVKGDPRSKYEPAARDQHTSATDSLPCPAYKIAPGSPGSPRPLRPQPPSRQSTACQRLGSEPSAIDHSSYSNVTTPPCHWPPPKRPVGHVVGRYEASTPGAKRCRLIQRRREKNRDQLPRYVRRLGYLPTRRDAGWASQSDGCGLSSLCVVLRTYGPSRVSTPAAAEKG